MLQVPRLMAVIAPPVLIGMYKLLQRLTTNKVPAEDVLFRLSCVLAHRFSAQDCYFVICALRLAQLRGVPGSKLLQFFRKHRGIERCAGCYLGELSLNQIVIQVGCA
jgi:hypothetical protein